MAIIYTATIDGNDYGFDFENKRIDVDAALLIINVENLWAAIKEAQASRVGVAFPVIATGGGLELLDPLEGSTTFLTVSLIDWVVNSLISAGRITISGGNLVRSDGSLPVADNPLVQYVNNTAQAGIRIVTAGDGALTPGDIADILAAIEGSTVLAKESTAQLAVALSAQLTLPSVLWYGSNRDELIV